MKKALSFVLAVMLVMSMAISASAVGSPTATKEDLKPTLVGDTAKNITIITVEDIEELPEEEQKVFVEAKDKLAGATPAGMAVKSFTYFSTTEKSVSAVLKMDVAAGAKMAIKQFVDGKWVELEYEINEDGTVTVLNVVSGPLAVFVG